MYDLSAWFCCLNPEERQILRQCAEGYVLSFGEGVPCEIYDAFWLVVTRSRNNRRAAFRAIFGLEEGELVIPPATEPTCVYTYTDDTFWLEVVAYILAPESACLDDCERWRPD